MFENILLSKVALSGEIVRMALAIIGTAVASYYDIRNNRNVPDTFLYAFLAVSFLASAFYYQQDVFLYGLIVAAAIFGLGMLFSRMGYVGGADVYVLASLSLLIPVFPSRAHALFNFPPVLSVIITACVAFALYFFYFIMANIVMKGKRGRYEYFLLLPVYLALMYFIVSTTIFGITYVFTVSALILSSILYMAYKEQVTEAMSKKIPLSKVENEDVAVLELMPELVKKYGIKRLLDEKEVARLKKLKLKELYVYTDLPPFLPFVLAGLLVVLLFGDLLTYSTVF